MTNKYFYLFITFFVIALIGLISVIANTRSVNLGAFIFPAVLAFIFFVKNKKNKLS